MSKSAEIAALVTRRIRQGDYRLRRFPSVLQLARDLQANPRTVTKAVDALVEQGVLRRSRTGRIAIHREASKKVLQVAFVQPVFPSALYGLLHQGLLRLVQARGWRLRPVGYSHWHDPLIHEALGGFDGVFFMPMAEDIPADVLQRLKAAASPVVVLDQDVSGEGLPCLRFHHANAVSSLLDNLVEAGHRTILCLNTQPCDSMIRERIDQWQLWVRVHQLQGRLVDEHVQVSESAMERARTILGQRLRAGDVRETAIFCTTGAAATGAMRALMDHGLQPGRDIAICAADDDGGRAQYLCPSLSCVATPDPSPYLDVCLDWFAGGGGEWIGPRLIRPLQTPIFVGESTAWFRGPAGGEAAKR